MHDKLRSWGKSGKPPEATWLWKTTMEEVDSIILLTLRQVGW